MDLLQGETPKFGRIAGIKEGYEKSGFLRTKALIYLKHGNIGPIEVQ